MESAGRPPRSTATSTVGAESRWARLTILVAALVLLLVIGGGGVGGWLYVRSLEKQVQKVEAFNGLQEAQRPVRAADSALNFLVVGKDQLEPGEATSRTDTIMLVHVPHSRNQAQVISIPRDTWTTIPESPPEVGGGPRMAKINAAYAWVAPRCWSGRSRSSPESASTTSSWWTSSASRR